MRGSWLRVPWVLTFLDTFVPQDVSVSLLRSELRPRPATAEVLGFRAGRRHLAGPAWSVGGSVGRAEHGEVDRKSSRPYQEFLYLGRESFYEVADGLRFYF